MATESFSRPCPGGSEMTKENPFPASCTATIEDSRYTYCEECVRRSYAFFSKCKNFETCGKYVKYSHVLKKELATCAGCMPKFDGQCPFCPGLCMVNVQTGQPFKTCWGCRTKCPNYEKCKGYRGKNYDGKRYRLCRECTFWGFSSSLISLKPRQLA